MKSENNKSAKGLLLFIGIIVAFGGLGADSFAVTAVGVVFVVIYFAVVKNKKSESSNVDIVSGVNKTMPDNNTYIRSLDNNGSAKTVSSNTIMYKEQISNQCPICKSVSANGYCTQCGYKFKK